MRTAHTPEKGELRRNGQKGGGAAGVSWIGSHFLFQNASQKNTYILFSNGTSTRYGI
jgi:hypothetical protein